MPEIKFQRVSKIYKPNIKAVDDLNFTIYDGEYISLLGPSGCGKTTTLRLLSGLIKPTIGSILWDGVPVENIDPDQRDIGYVFQQFAIFPHLNVYENVAFGPRVKGMKQVDIEDITEAHLKLVGLQEKSYYFPKSLDAADLQRTGIARVLATGAKTLLLDEPMGALDFKIREKFQDELLRIVKELKLTAIHVTHDQSEGMAISDRIGVMKKGKMIQISSPLDYLYSPKQIFSAHFIGESDFFEGVVVKYLSKTIEIELLGDETLSILTKTNPSILPGDRVVVGVRREFFKIEPLPENYNLEVNCFVGKVISDRFLGEKRRTKVNLEFGRTLEIKRNSNELVFKEGSSVLVRIPEQAIRVFKSPEISLIDELEVT
ncbi:MAG: ABC transporter ATP-binding protein [Candidatus Heimdallarchaeota archaeon]|nr:ABC transporter ATP-binding protein [Candidatus Heimdallarchaeota archaeon]MDH5644504.1 ABC transporter ATP-binding protein [Candidatus Heimdallarchaeota archaeon]